MRRLLILGLLVSASPAAFGEEIRVLSWNVESGGNDVEVISRQLKELQEATDPYDLIGLTEVRDSSAAAYEKAVEVDGIDYRGFVSNTGGSDRLVILFRTDRFKLAGSDAVNLASHDGRTFPGGSSRRPLMVQLDDSENGDLAFIFMVNHLTRGNDQNRRLQAELLREWARDQSLPVVAVGDYNFDFDFHHLTGNRSMAIFMRRDASDRGAFVWKWIIPSTEIETTGNNVDRRVTVVTEFVDTNWSDRNSDGRDDFPDSMLDFVFVAQGAKGWKATSTVIVRDGDFPDDYTTSDHRPVEAIFDPGPN